MSWISRLWPQMEAVTAWLRTRRLARRLRTRADIEAWQQKRLARFRREVLPRMGFYAGLAEVPFEALPVIDKAVLMGRFADFNRLGLTAERGWQALADGGRLHGHFVGASTGTSGNRGLYVISEAERWRWLGTMLAKTLPRLRRARVALILPLDTSLYEAAGRSFLQFRFFDLNKGVEACGREAAAFDPNIVIAPPKVLRWLAGSGLTFGRIKHVFSAAEVLDELDRAAIEARFGVIVRQIYMATEGLLGVACDHGTLHLCEDTMRFEYETPVAGSGLVAPVITDFSRETQAMVRYRMNDLLRLAEAPCPCGSPLQAVAQVAGRVDDLLMLASGMGVVSVTPDILRNAIVNADRRIDDFRLVQTGAEALELSLPEALPMEAAEAACEAVRALLARLHVTAEVTLRRVPVLEISAKKLRRVERRWRGE